MEKSTDVVEVSVHTSVRMNEVLNLPGAAEALKDAHLLDQGCFPGDLIPGD